MADSFFFVKRDGAWETRELDVNDGEFWFANPADLAPIEDEEPYWNDYGVAVEED